MTDKKPTGILFFNDRKTKANAPDYNGRIELDADFLREVAASPKDENGRYIIRLAGWIKTSSNSGKDFISLRPEVLREAPPPRPAPSQDRREKQPQAKAKTMFDDDEIPF